MHSFLGVGFETVDKLSSALLFFSVTLNLPDSCGITSLIKCVFSIDQICDFIRVSES